jgi:hypothetical protein
MRLGKAYITQEKTFGERAMQGSNLRKKIPTKQKSADKLADSMTGPVYLLSAKKQMKTNNRPPILNQG